MALPAETQRLPSAAAEERSDEGTASNACGGRLQGTVGRHAQPGSIPLFLIIGPASGAVRDFISALAAAGAGAAECRPAE